MDTMDTMDTMDIIFINRCCGNGFKYMRDLTHYLSTNKIKHNKRYLNQRQEETRTLLTEDEVKNLNLQPMFIIDGVKCKAHNWKSIIQSNTTFLNSITKK